MKKISKMLIAIVLLSTFSTHISFANTNIDSTDRYAKVLLDGSFIDFNCSLVPPNSRLSTTPLSFDTQSRLNSISGPTNATDLSSGSNTSSDSTVQATSDARSGSPSTVQILISPASPNSPSAPSSQQSVCDVMVSNHVVTGSAFGQNTGWINLSPSDGGVLNDTHGNLSGYAWGNSAGWINFNPQNGGVMIDGGGFFHGMAWSQNFGWIIFNCDTEGTCGTENYKVRTSWRPGSADASSSGSSPTPPSSTGTNTPSGPSSTPTGPSNNPSGTPGSTPGGTTTPTGTTPDETNTPTTPTTPSQSSIVLAAIFGLILNAFENLKSFLSTIRGDITFKTVAAVGILSAIFSTPLSSWRSALSILAFKKRKPWGTVYDSVTEQPLDPAYVVLQDMQGNEVGTSITDLDGRYGFIVDPGMYRIVANKTNYVFPSKKLADRTHDELYQDLYFGGEIKIQNTGDVIMKNIPMDAMNFDWNEFAKKQKKLTKFYSRRDLWLSRISTILFGAGFIVSIFAYAVDPQPINFVIAALYVIVFLLRKTTLKQKPQGYVSEKSTGLPLSFSILRVFSASLNTEIIHKVADAIGKYYCLVPNGSYYVKIEKKNPDGSYAPAYTSEPFEVTKGYIKKSFEI